MSVPNAAMLSRIKDLLRVPDATTTHDALIDQAYDGVISALVWDTDWIVDREEIAAVADQSIYTLATTRTTRVLAVFHNRLALARVTARNLDLLSAWTTEASGTPEKFSLNAIPPSVDGLVSIVPEQLILIPAPSVSAVGEQGIVVFSVRTPTGDPPGQYLTDLLVFGTAARASLSETEIRDKTAGEFWEQVYKMFEQTIGQIVP